MTAQIPQNQDADQNVVNNDDEEDSRSSSETRQVDVSLASVDGPNIVQPVLDDQVSKAVSPLENDNVAVEANTGPTVQSSEERKSLVESFSDDNVQQEHQEEPTKSPFESLETAKKFMTEKSGVHFDTWWIRPLSVSPQLLIIVEGQRYTVASSESSPEYLGTQLWHSSVIKERADPRLLKSSSGNSYYLHGDLDCDSMRKVGFTQSSIDIFMNGFPDNWKAVLSEPDCFENVDDDYVNQDDKEIENQNTEQFIAQDHVKRQRNEKSSKVSPAPKKRLVRHEEKLFKDPLENSSSLHDDMNDDNGRNSLVDTSKRSTRRNSSGVVKIEWGTGRVVMAKSQLDGAVDSKTEDSTSNTDSDLVLVDLSRVRKKERTSPDRFYQEFDRRGKQRNILKPLQQIIDTIEEKPDFPGDAKPWIQRRFTVRKSRRSDEHNASEENNQMGWTPEQDEQLSNAISLYNPHSSHYWRKVAAKVPSKTEDECKERFQTNFGKPTKYACTKPKSLPTIPTSSDVESHNSHTSFVGNNDASTENIGEIPLEQRLKRRARKSRLEGGSASKIPVSSERVDSHILTARVSDLLAKIDEFRNANSDDDDFQPM